MQASVCRGVQLNAPAGRWESASGGLPPQYLPPSIIARVLRHPFPLSLTGNVSGARMLVMELMLVGMREAGG